MFNEIDNKMEKNKDGMWEDKELKKVTPPPTNYIIDDVYCELEKAIKEDYEWAKQTQIILENFNDEDEKSKSLAFLNGVLFATGRYNDILDELKED